MKPLDEQDTREADHAYAAYTRDWQFTQLLCTVLRLAGERHAEDVRAALASVFDLSVYESEARRLRAMHGVALKEIGDLHGRIAALAGEVSRLGDELELMRAGDIPH